VALCFCTAFKKLLVLCTKSFNILEIVLPRPQAAPRQFFSRYVKERFRGLDIQITIIKFIIFILPPLSITYKPVPPLRPFFFTCFTKYQVLSGQTHNALSHAWDYCFLNLVVGRKILWYLSQRSCGAY
jgi:hypothetical protein